MSDPRQGLLQQWASGIDRAARSGALFNDPNKAIALRDVEVSAPDGRSVIFTSDWTGHAQVYEVDLAIE